jgi:cytidylate kinase
VSGAGVVTVSASYGAGGDLVGPAVAARMGLVFHDRAIPAQVAGRLGVPLAEAEANDENVARGLWRIVASLGTMPDPMGGVVPVTEQLDERTFRMQTERVVREIADGPGGVVLGRAAAVVLGDRPDALHVRLDGPEQRRLDAVVARTGRPRDEVRRELRANDAARMGYVRRSYRVDPTSPRNYHLVIDSTALPLQTVVDLVVEAARARGIG